MTNNTASPQKKPTRLGLSSRRWLIGIPVCIALVTVAFQVVFFQRDNSNQDLLAGRAEFRIVQDSARLTVAETTHDAASPSSVIPSACPSSSPSAAPSMSPSASPAAAMDQMYDAQSYALYDDSSSAAKAKGLDRARLLSMESYGKYLLSDSFDSDKRYQYHHGDQFQSVEDNSIKKTMSEPVSTFSVDVDTSSYSYVRRLLKDWRLPPRDAVKVEEFINYFDYEYPQPPNREVPFEATVAVSKSPWHKGQKLLHIGIKGYGMDPSDRPYSNLVFLVDVSGSMGNIDRLPLAKEAMEMLLNTMQPEDLVSIVTYASNVNVPLPPTPVADKKHILSVLNSLSASGSTWGTGGIEKAYELAEKNFDKDAVNRIMLLTDGDFNIGLMDNYSLKTYIETKRETGIFLSVLGFGMGNYKDDFMKSLANNGNGVAAYVDSLEEAHKVMVTEASSTMFPIAKDVKVQVEFNPAKVAEYRLVGYEKRLLRREDFNNDKVDAADIGAGHAVTALYEIKPVGWEEKVGVDELRYSQPVLKEQDASTKLGQEYAFVKMRYKLPDEDESKLISKAATVEDEMDRIAEINDSSMHVAATEFKFATAVASFAQLLKGEAQMDGFSYGSVLELAEANIGDDPYGYRREFIRLVRTAKRITQESNRIVEEANRFQTSHDIVID
uniref:VWFA domain-containing protein n=1 Tax=Ditylum brightwellii TaxID=49249 RepID=A0A7S4W6C2_9STRA|mmetsp:Transcript_10738/g.14410  ORF Transcript_10738/g.14410 Transcript_10738/m.14410 type:complete len:667 (-) Transcript_10738:290-2290(-)